MKAVRLLLPIAVLLGLAVHALPASSFSKKPPNELAKLEARYAQFLARYRPDLAADWGVATPLEEHFIGLSEATIQVHLSDLRDMLVKSKALPKEARSESLVVRLEREIAQTEPGGALGRDHLLWLDIVTAAARAPLETGPRSGCSRTNRVTRQLRAVPEALRGAAIMLREAPPPDNQAFESRVARVEWLFRQDLPSRTEVCKEPRRLVEFTRADTLAARALAVFRRRVISTP